jgi:TPR repeat protein
MRTALGNSTRRLPPFRNWPNRATRRQFSAWHRCIYVAKGLELLETAVALGNSTAAFNLGALHRSGDCDVPIDREKSKAYFRRAKELGCELSVEPYL